LPSVFEPFREAIRPSVVSLDGKNCLFADRHFIGRARSRVKAHFRIILKN
jgi:hypothetical protein